MVTLIHRQRPTSKVTIVGIRPIPGSIVPSLNVGLLIHQLNLFHVSYPGERRLRAAIFGFFSSLSYYRAESRTNCCF